MSVRQAQSAIDAAEFAEWWAYYQMEPWGEARADLRAGIVASVVANRHRGRKEPQYEPKDFMPKLGAEAAPKKQSAESMRAMFKLLTKQAGGVVQSKAA